ncbi:MAG TPA: hypothetical protein VF459_16755 [Caulobacteraceae bacterium]
MRAPVLVLKVVESKLPTKKPKSRKALTAANLEALGAARLAALLLDLADGAPATKRRLRMELAAEAGPEELAAEIEKPLEGAKAAHGRVHWRKLKGLRQDLELLQSMIVGPLAAADAAAAASLLLRFLGLERGVLARVKDVKGEVAQIFAAALADLARIAAEVKAPPAEFVDTIMSALEDAGPGAMGQIVEALIPALGAPSVAQLRVRIETQMAPHRRVNAGWRAALQAVLDAQGDAAAYAATYSASEAVLPPVGARIAQRFLEAGQLEEAAAALFRSDPFVDASGRAMPFSPTAPSDPGLRAWQAVRIDLLEAKGDAADAQAARWSAFERDLSPEQLRAYLKRLSGFDDVVAGDRAIEHAKTYRPIGAALSFLIGWPALKEAAGLVTSRAQELMNADIEVLEPAVRALEGRYPLAATLLLRAMVRDVVRYGQTDLYSRARVWLLEAASLAGQVGDLEGQEEHAEFEAKVAAALRR